MKIANVEPLANAAANTLFGLPIQQSWLDLFAWEQFLAVCGDGIDRILELGTSAGTMSFFLDCQCLNRGADFRSIDINGKKLIHSPIAEKLELPQHCSAEDCFSAETIREVETWVAREGRCLLYCDNGNKPRELATFAPLLRQGDFVAVHDWGTEVTPGNSPLLADERYCPIPVMPADLEQFCLTRFWRVAHALP